LIWVHHPAVISNTDGFYPEPVRKSPQKAIKRPENPYQYE